MIRSLYTAVSGLITLENKQSTIANNMANANTTGYKTEDLAMKSFNEVLIQNRDKLVGNTYYTQKLGTISLGTEIDDVITKFTQGDLKQTESNTDFAINGRGFFVVQNGNREVYTRDGGFIVDNNGYLITTTGDRVLGLNNATGATEPIYIGNAQEFYIDDNNRLVIDGVSTQTLKTADFEDYSTLEKIGDNYYTAANPVYNARVSVVQNYLESSNVNITNEMVNMMTVMRSFESTQKVLSMLDETLGIAASKVGKV